MFLYEQISKIYYYTQKKRKVWNSVSSVYRKEKDDMCLYIHKAIWKSKQEVK